MTLKTYLEQVKVKSEVAHKEICDLAKGSRKWEMCVPHQKTDSDFVLQAPLDDIPTLIEIIKKQDEALEFYSLASVMWLADHDVHTEGPLEPGKIKWNPGKCARQCRSEVEAMVRKEV